MLTNGQFPFEMTTEELQDMAELLRRIEDLQDLECSDLMAIEMELYVRGEL
jgi:hypothetical protein